MTPLIGLTTRNATSPIYGIPMVATPRSYIDALARAGAAFVLLPLGMPYERLELLLEILDGVIFTGGGDIETARFNGESHPEVDGVQPERDELELQMARDVAEGGLPFLGICRGLQVVNVAFGGSLYTHIADQLPGALEHYFYPDWPRDHIAHPVQVSEDSLLAVLVGEPVLQVNSLHHQGVKDLAPNLTPVARAPDGLVEALELHGHPFGLAVQWHPECLPDDSRMQAIFDAFVAAAANHKS